MRHLYRLLLGAILALMLPMGLSYGNVSNYQFLDTYGDPIKAEGTPTEILSVGDDDVVTVFTPKVAKGDPAFTFYFDNKPYTTFSASSNGLIGFGSSAVTRDYENELTSTGGLYTLASVPQIAPFWDDQFVLSDKETGLGDGNVSYFVNGTAPNRVLVIEFNNMQIAYDAYFDGYTIPGSLSESTN